MEIIYVMLGVSLLLSFVFLSCFFWANKKQQFQDLDSPAWRAVFDDSTLVKSKKNKGDSYGTKT